MSYGAEQLELCWQKDLQDKQQRSVFRSRIASESETGVYIDVEGERFHNFSSNDYLGLASHPSIKAAAIKSVQRYGVGSGASHLVTGHHREHQLLEQELAEFTGREAALLFGSGFSANNAVLMTLLGKNDIVFQDKLNHASLVDGGLHCGATMRRYAHNDINHLERLLCAPNDADLEDITQLIVSDSVFSMDGDVAPVKDLVRLSKKYNTVLMLDDAHGFGLLGEHGAGIVEHATLSQEDLPILMATLGKALGVSGAFVAGSQALINTLVNGARHYIYSTAMPPALASAARAALKIVKHEPERRQKLIENIHYFRERLMLASPETGKRLLDSETAIQGLVTGDNELTLKLSEALKKRGYWLTAIRPPTVPANTARLRITLSAAHSTEQIEGLISALCEEGRPL